MDNQSQSQNTEAHLAVSTGRSTGREAAEGEAPYSLYHVDDCMYVAALSAEDAAAYVRAECGEGCGESVEPASLGMKVEMANLDDGEKPTKDSKKTARELIEEHLRFGGTLPDTICFDSGM